MQNHLLTWFLPTIFRVFINYSTENSSNKLLLHKNNSLAYPNYQFNEFPIIYVLTFLINKISKPKLRNSISMDMTFLLKYILINTTFSNMKTHYGMHQVPMNDCFVWISKITSIKSTRKQMDIQLYNKHLIYI